LLGKSLQGWLDNLQNGLNVNVPDLLSLRRVCGWQTGQTTVRYCFKFVWV